MDRRWADAEILLHVGFGRWAAVQARIEVDKRQVLALLGRETFCRATHAGHPIQLFVRASKHEEAQMNLRYRRHADCERPWVLRNSALFGCVPPAVRRVAVGDIASIRLAIQPWSLICAGGWFAAGSANCDLRGRGGNR